MTYLSRFSLIIIILASTFLIAKGQESSGKKLGEINMTVTNVLGFPISRIKVIFESVNLLVEGETDEKGKIRVGLMPGIFEIRTSDWKGKLPYNKNESFYSGDCLSYFRPYQRAPIKLNVEDKITLNLILDESGCVDLAKDGSGGGFSISSHGSSTKINYERISIPNSELDICIQYDYREEKEYRTIFSNTVLRQTPAVWSEPRQGIVVSYNLINIYGSQAEYDRESRLITITNDALSDKSKNVILEENGKITSYKQIKIKIDDETPKFIFEK